MVKTVVFVQGGKAREQEFPWMFFHFDPVRETPLGPFNVAFFDFLNAKLKEWDNITLTRGAAPSRVPDRETALTPTVQIRLMDGSIDAGAPRASVLALYDWVKRQPKGSVASLQIFSHGDEVGPIIFAECFEFDSTGARLNPLDDSPRDAHDTEFRMRDFRGSNPLSGAEGWKFRRAFVSEPFIKLYGCEFTQSARASVQRFFRAPRGPRGDATRQAHLISYLDHIGNAYPMLLATSLDFKVWASPGGWGSQPWADVDVGEARPRRMRYTGRFPPNLDNERWWRVSWYFRNQDRGARFYKDVLHAQIDKTDFVQYDRAWFQAAMRAAGGPAAVTAPSLPVTTPARLAEEVVDKANSLIPKSITELFR